MRKSLGWFVPWIVSAAVAAITPAFATECPSDPRIQQLENGLLPKDGNGRTASITQRMQELGIPGVSLAVIDGGKIICARAYGVRDAVDKTPVTAETLFLAGSISKPVAALGALRLVKEGRLALDEDVNAKLKTWRVPENEFTKGDKVTLRRLVSHTAGLTVHGFPGYAVGAQIPTVVQVLNGEPPANTPSVRVDVRPGSLYRYSGGGYTVMQLLMSDVTNTSFESYMTPNVLDVLGMKSSTFAQNLPPALAQRRASGHRPGGERIAGEIHLYPEMAAAGLWTTASELARYALYVQAAARGDTGPLLDASLVKELLTRQNGQHGLGPQIFEVGQFARFGHGGVDEGFEATLDAYVTQGKGVVIMANVNGAKPFFDELKASVARAYSWPAFPATANEARAIDAKQRLEPVREYIRAQLAERPVPSIAVAVARDGQILWEEGFGWADREKRIPADEHTMYSLASISKPLTATGLMVLAQAGRIDLDRPANDYLGAARLQARVGDASAATVRRIANHTSGLPLHYQFFYADEPVRRPPMDETLRRYGYLMTAPGERFEYSNLGYGVLDYLIERVSGQSYAEFMRREVFVPLGLTHTSVDIPAGMEGFTATRYDADGKPIPFYTFDHPGGSAVFASAHDLVRFGMFHLKSPLPSQRRILSNATLDEMHRASTTDVDGGYGVGFNVGERYGYRTLSHGGAMGGVATSMTLFPDQQLAVVVLSNAADELTRLVAQRVIATQLPNWTMVDRPEPQAPPAFKATPALTGRWQGRLRTYQGDSAVELRFLADGKVRARFADQPEVDVSEPRFEKGLFSGSVDATIKTDDAARYAHTILLSLTLRGKVLNGAATANRAPASRVRNALSYWLELKKQ